MQVHPEHAELTNFTGQFLGKLATFEPRRDVRQNTPFHECAYGIADEPLVRTQIVVDAERIDGIETVGSYRAVVFSG